MAARNYIELVEKTIRVIEVLAQAGGRRSLKEIAAATGLVKSSAFRILFTLRQLGYVERGPDGSYQLSLKVISLAKGAAAKASLTSQRGRQGDRGAHVPHGARGHARRTGVAAVYHADHHRSNQSREPSVPSPAAGLRRQ